MSQSNEFLCGRTILIPITSPTSVYCIRHCINLILDYFYISRCARLPMIFPILSYICIFRSAIIFMACPNLILSYLTFTFPDVQDLPLLVPILSYLVSSYLTFTFPEVQEFPLLVPILSYLVLSYLTFTFPEVQELPLLVPATCLPTQVAQIKEGLLTAVPIDDTTDWLLLRPTTDGTDTGHAATLFYTDGLRLPAVLLRTFTCEGVDT